MRGFASASTFVQRAVFSKARLYFVETPRATLATRAKTINKMTPQELFVFDLNGYIVVRGALNTTEVETLNNAIDAHVDESFERKDALRNTEMGSPLTGDGTSGRIDLGGMLGWETPHRDGFRNLLNHPKLLPYLLALCGEGYRLDHQPFCILQNKGSEGFSLHGGPLTSSGRFNPSLQYVCKQGSVYNSLLAMSVALSDHDEGNGGFVVVKGSHKCNFPIPTDMVHGRDMQEHVYQPILKKGDVVFFSEATCHGSRPWTADHQRRIALYRFAPSEIAYGRSYLDQAEGGWPKTFVEGCTKQQLAVLSPPYNMRLDRDYVTKDGDVSSQTRSDAKKLFDKNVFKTDYF
eukprot:m.51231 g.51231  ORF g.51231 m.51231 type:complete len:348 (+) comp21414_c1_seq1:168-1211(+)